MATHLPNLSIALRVLSRLLAYPDSALRVDLIDMRAALHADSALSTGRKDELYALMQKLETGDPLRNESEFIELFDRGRSTSLHLFEHVHGDSRDRGQAMIDLIKTYEQAGLFLAPGELPDYLPALLEFLSQVPSEHAQKLLGDAVHVIAHIGGKLQDSGSPYAALLQGVAALSPVAPQPLIEPPVRDMDEAMETFGPDVSGVEPLLKPAVETVQFYPKNAYAAQKGAVL